MKDIDQIRRENLIAESSRLGGDTELGRLLEKDKNQIYQWLRAPEGPQRRNMRKTTAREIERALGRGLGWLDIDHSNKAGASDEAVPLFTPERRADDNVTAVQIAIRALAMALLPKSQGTATEFLAGLTTLCKQKHFSPDHYLLGQLSDIAEQVQSDEEAASREQLRASTARHTKQGT